MAERNIIVIGCSMGGVEALQTLVGGLPAKFDASLFVVLHIAPETTSFLPDILSRAGDLPASHARDGERFHTGHIYVAPPDHHLMLEQGKMRVTRGPKENRHRPAIDPLFRSAARFYGRRVIGVLLTGSLDDGTAGLLNIKRRGGVAVVQDPEEALAEDMPRNAIESMPIDYVARVAKMPNLLTKLASQQVSENGAGGSSRLTKETHFAELDMDAIEDENRPGTPSQFACPSCGGVLWELTAEEVLRFRCRVGHAFTADSLSAEQNEAVESALWAAMRALEEGASLAYRLADRAKEGKRERMVKRYMERAKDKEQQAGVLRKLLLHGQEVPAA